MIVNLDTHRVKTLDDVWVFVASSKSFHFTVAEREAAYPWIEATLRQLGYKTLGKTDKGLVKAYLEKATGFTRCRII